MTDFWMVMWKPLVACFILSGIHAYLGIHVVERKVIFVDLALAQMAALGAVMASLFGMGLHAPATYWFSLVATFTGALVFSWTRTRHEKIPQEAIIGIVYALSAAASILLLSRSAEGDEHIRYMLVGNILLVAGPELVHTALLYGLVGLLHWRCRRQFLLISTQPDEALAQGLSVRGWDFAFYLTFGFVVTSSVQIAGVLLVFSFLVVPAVSAMLFFHKLYNRLLFGWLMAFLCSLIGVVFSYHLDLPTGATIVCMLGIAFFLLFAKKGHTYFAKK